MANRTIAIEYGQTAHRGLLCADTYESEFNQIRAETVYMVEVFVKGDVDRALRILKRKLSEDGDQRRRKERKCFTPQNERRRKKAVKAGRKRRR